MPSTTTATPGRGFRPYSFPMYALGDIPLIDPSDPTNVSTVSSQAAKLATSMTVSAIPPNCNMPSGTWIPVESPTGNKVTPVQLAADVIAGATSMTVKPLSEDILAASKIKFPFMISGRSTGNLDRTGQTQTFNVFEIANELIVGTGFSSNVTLDGLWQMLDAAFLNAEQALLDQSPMILYLVLPTKDNRFTRGPIYYGAANVTGLPVNSEAAGLIQSNMTAGFVGEIMKALPKWK